MKTLICTLGIIMSASLALAQGTLNYDNEIANSVVAPVYGPELSDPMIVIQGNTASGTPPGTAVYTGNPLMGAAWTAQLWAALGTNRVEEELTAVASSAVPFSTDPGFIEAPTELLTVPGVEEGMIATLQLRVWDNDGGLISSFDDAVAEGRAWGVSKLFNSQPLGGAAPGPNLEGLESFNVHVPEPSTFVLALIAVGAACLLRRRS